MPHRRQEGHAAARPTTEQQKAIAIELLLHAWEDALEQGCAPELVASSALCTALSDMVELFGENTVADMIDAIPDRIRRGDFSLTSTQTH